MNAADWRLLFPRFKVTVGAFCVALWFASPAVPQRLAAEAPASPNGEDQPAERPPESAPAPDQPARPSASHTAEPPTDPHQILEEAIAAMDIAAQELEGDGPSANVVSEQELAVQLLRKLLSAPQSSPNSQPQSAGSTPPPSPDDESSSTAKSNAAPNGSGGRRADDENSAESSENVAGPTQADSSTLAPKTRTNSVWGHLPPRQQESLLRSLSDSFLPGYESQIKRYYEALAEGKNREGKP